MRKLLGECYTSILVFTCIKHRQCHRKESSTVVSVTFDSHMKSSNTFSNQLIFGGFADVKIVTLCSRAVK